MTKFQSWPLWVQQLVVIPHIPIIVWLLIRTPKTKKASYFAFGFIVYMVVFYFIFIH